jgi:hypothetical protein
MSYRGQYIHNKPVLCLNIRFAFLLNTLRADVQNYFQNQHL